MSWRETSVDLAGRRALVLGAGGVAGAAVAVALAEVGADVAVAAASIEGTEVMAVRRARRRVAALGRRTAEYAFDVTLGANVQVSTRQVAKDLGGLDILVYAVDHVASATIEKTTDAEWSRVLNLNLSGAFYACRSAVREMGAGPGRIILLGSSFGADEGAGAVAYAAARHGLTGIVTALAREVFARGIRVNGITPAWLHEAAEPVQAATSAAKTAAPAGQLIEPEDIAPLAIYLASDHGDGITGQLFHVRSAGTADG